MSDPHSLTEAITPEAAAVIEAARQMPRGTPGPGGCGTVHQFGIEAGVVWTLDIALKRFDEALAMQAARP
jgi:hypothetical protein